MKAFSLPKSQRISGKTAVSAVLSKGRGGLSGCLRYKVLVRPCHFDQGPEDCVEKSPSRILVSVPKKSFKRAVRRNLLKRRIREAYRLQKGLIGPGLDIMFVYVSREVLPFADIYASMTAALEEISRLPSVARNDNDCHFDQGPKDRVEKSHTPDE